METVPEERKVVSLAKVTEKVTKETPPSDASNKQLDTNDSCTANKVTPIKKSISS